MNPSFKDHFSTGSAAYAAYRPGYPDALFSFLGNQSPDRHLAWDCATGSGQAAIGLAAHFQHVIATDASQKQVTRATPHARVRYQTASAENSLLADNSIDLITVAQALHWFNIEDFFNEARRVLKPRGILAVWTYNLIRLEPAIDELIEQLYFDRLAGFWPDERRLVEEGYSSIPFPFTRLASPAFTMQAEWSLEQLLGYLNTWSAVKKKSGCGGGNPVEQMRDEFAQHWGRVTEKRSIHWPLSLTVGHT